jgi:hypothetical protein
MDDDPPDGLGRICIHSGEEEYKSSVLIEGLVNNIKYDCVSCERDGKNREFRRGEAGCVFPTDCLGCEVPPVVISAYAKTG